MVLHYFNLLNTAAIVAIITLFCACAPNKTILESNPASTPLPSSPAANLSIRPVEKEVEAMRTADFNFIFVLRRKDGAAMSADDKTAIRSLTKDANRRSLSDDGLAVIVGSNYRLPAEAMLALRDRFEIQDFSKPEPEINNSNTPANANMKRRSETDAP